MTKDRSARCVRCVTASYPLLLERGHLAGQMLAVLGVLVVDEPLLHLGHDALLQLQTHAALLLQAPPQAGKLRPLLAQQLAAAKVHTHTHTHTHTSSAGQYI